MNNPEEEPTSKESTKDKSLLIEALNLPVKQIVVFGETGVGKSSIINMILGSSIAPTSSSSVGCTFEHNTYPGSIFTFHDTVGLGEGSGGKVASIRSLKMLSKLLSSLRGGIHCLIYVIKKGRITQNMELNYNFFYETICERQVPIILVVTHCELDAKRGEWWDREKEHFTKYGLTFDAVISGSGISGGDIHPIFKELIEMNYVETKMDLFKALEDITYSGRLMWGPPTNNIQLWMSTILHAALALLFGTNGKLETYEYNDVFDALDYIE